MFGFEKNPKGGEGSGKKEIIKHPRATTLEYFLLGMKSAVSRGSCNGKTLVELFYLADMDRYGMVRQDIYENEKEYTSIQNFSQEINRCIAAVEARLSSGDIPSDWHEQLLQKLNSEGRR